jgi:hypothetical protein
MKLFAEKRFFVVSETTQAPSILPRACLYRAHHPQLECMAMMCPQHTDPAEISGVLHVR